MAVAVGDVTKVVCKMRDRNNSLIENRFFVHNSGLAPVADDDFMTDIEAAMSEAYEYIDTYMPDDLEPSEIECDQVIFAGAELVTVRPVGTIAWTTWGGGEATGDALPQGVAAVINYPTVVPRVRGMKFLGPLAETAQTNGDLVSGMLIALANFGTATEGTFLIDLQDFDFGVMSTKAAIFVAFTGYVLRTPCGYQRRRKPGVGV